MIYYLRWYVRNYIIIDNTSIHKTGMVKMYFLEELNIAVFPPNFYQLNSIEEFF